MRKNYGKSENIFREIHRKSAKKRRKNDEKTTKNPGKIFKKFANNLYTKNLRIWQKFYEKSKEALFRKKRNEKNLRKI